MRKTQSNDILIDVIGKTLTNNILLKGVSVAVAVVVWLLVVNVDDPIITSNIAGVAVQVQNEAYIESGGKMSLIKEGENIISVEVKGKRSIVDKLTPEDLVATADLKQIVNMNTDPIMVPIAVTCSKLKSADLMPNPRNLSVAIDDIMTQEYIVTVTSGESQPGKGYEIGTLSANPDKVSITGPQSLVRKIDKVVASVEEGHSRARNTAAPINTLRLNKKTPCAVTGRCSDCQSPDCICSQIVVTRRSHIPGRIQVILIGEELGY